MRPPLRHVRVPELAPPPEPFWLSFLMPRELTAGLSPGTHAPCQFKCLLTVERHRDRDYLVRVRGPSRELVFDQARRYLRLAAKSNIARGEAFQIGAMLLTPGHIMRDARDPWTIIVAADVAFSPTGIGADLPPPAGQGVLPLFSEG